MDNKEFKREITRFFKEIGFNKNKKCYYKEYDDFYLKFDLQKSEFYNGWYVNYGVLIKELHKEEELLDNLKKDSIARVSFDGFSCDEKNIIDMDAVKDNSDLKTLVCSKIQEIVSLFEEGILNYISAYPTAIYAFSVWAQEYLLNNKK